MLTVIIVLACAKTLSAIIHLAIVSIALEIEKWRNMSELNPEIWDNKTLGAAAQNQNLDVLEKQQIEDRNAKIEEREPREVVHENYYPGWEPEKNRPSYASNVHFADEQENDVPTGGETEPETGAEYEPGNEPETSEDVSGEASSSEEESSY